jgi:hypothetical protein
MEISEYSEFQLLEKIERRKKIRIATASANHGDR